MRCRTLGRRRKASSVTRNLARILTANGRFGLRARLAERLDEPLAGALAQAAAVHVVTLDVRGVERAAVIAAALNASGGTARSSGVTVTAVATAGQVAAARHRLPECAAECDALERACHAADNPPRQLRLRDRSLDLEIEARVMGILNVTPDSFYERVAGTTQAVERARAMAAAGAALVDIGGQSYAHWNPRIAADAERARVVPAVEAIVAAGIDIAISIDTFKAEVAAAALAAGAHLINDCSGLADPALADTVARYDAGLVVMHIKGELNVRSSASYVYDDALTEIVAFLYERTERARAAGVARDAIAIDPGLEFGKEPTTDLEVLERFGELTALGYPILFASSRKSFIGRLFHRPAKELLIPSLATAALGIAAGARIVRVHDIAETAQLAHMLAAVDPRRRRTLEVADRMPGTPEATGNSMPPKTV